MKKSHLKPKFKNTNNRYCSLCKIITKFHYNKQIGHCECSICGNHYNIDGNKEYPFM